MNQTLDHFPIGKFENVWRHVHKRHGGPRQHVEHTRDFDSRDAHAYNNQGFGKFTLASGQKLCRVEDDLTVTVNKGTGQWQRSEVEHDVVSVQQQLMRRFQFLWR